jgi:hypothetical protein
LRGDIDKGQAAQHAEPVVQQADYIKPYFEQFPALVVNIGNSAELRRQVFSRSAQGALTQHAFTLRPKFITDLRRVAPSMQSQRTFGTARLWGHPRGGVSSLAWFG